MSEFPSRIVCLSAETAETLYAIGAGDRVIAVSAYAVHPAEVRQKPRVSAFITAGIDRIVGLSPDLVLGFSDLQAGIARDLVARGVPVVIFNQRTITEILQMIRMTGGLVGLSSKAAHLCGNLEQGLTAIRLAASFLPRRPRVYFEEWPDPIIGGIQWVQELIAAAGGDPAPAIRADARLASARQLDADDIRRAEPDVILASWCGRRVRKERITSRPGWENVPAVRRGHVYEIRAPYILQPGPTALTEGARQLHAIFRQAVGAPPEPAIGPQATWR